MEKLKIVVEWSESGHITDEAINLDKARFEQCVENYIERFNSLPPIGLQITHGWDTATIKDICYNGPAALVWVWIVFK